jgi:transposase
MSDYDSDHSDGEEAPRVGRGHYNRYQTDLYNEVARRVLEDGQSYAAVSREMRMPESTIKHCVARVRAGKPAAPDHHGGSKSYVVTDEMKADICRIVEHNPVYTLAQVFGGAIAGVSLTITNVFQFLADSR